MVDDKCAVGGLEALEREAMVVSVEASAVALASRADVAELAEAKPSTSPSWATWSRTWKSSPWRRSISSFCPSGYLRSLTFEIIDFFLGYPSKVLKIMPRQKQTRAGQWTRVKTFCHHWGLQETCQFECQVLKEVATAIHGATILAKLAIVRAVRLLGRQEQRAPHRLLQGDRPLLWLRAGAPHPCPQEHWHCPSLWAQEAAADGWNWQLLHLCQGLPRNLGQLCQGHFWCHFQDLQLSYTWSLERDVVHQVSVSGLLWPSSKDSY